MGVLSTVGCVATLGLFCKIHYFFVAQEIDGCSILSGKVNHNLSLGRAQVEFLDDSFNKCNGHTRVTYYPKMVGCKGQEGTITGLCENGSHVVGTWVAKSCSTGYGEARKREYLGKNYKFVFGLSKDEVIETINRYRSEQGCAGLSVDGYIINTEVSGKVVPMGSFKVDGRIVEEELLRERE